MRGLQTPSVVRSFSDLPGTHEDFVPRTGTSDDPVSSPGPLAASAPERGGGAPRAASTDTASTPSAVVVIPARYGSSRLPAKALADIGGKPMVVRVLECARGARGVKRVLVATDDHQIQRAVQQAGGEAVLTSPEHPSGTDRIAEVARRLDDDVIVNVQGDLPFLDPGYVEAALEALGRPAVAGESAPMATLATPLLDGEAARPQVVKVVCDRHGRALYFSRSMIPSGGAEGLRHIGLYAYRREFLLELARMEPTPLEKREKLEQLRVLENGYRIQVAQVEAQESMIEVDTPEDLRRVRQWLTAGRESAVRERDG